MNHDCKVCTITATGACQGGARLALRTWGGLDVVGLWNGRREIVQKKPEWPIAQPRVECRVREGLVILNASHGMRSGLVEVTSIIAGEE